MGELIKLQQNTSLGFNLETEQLTMSSLEISIVTEKEHRNVKRDIRSMLESLGLDVLRYEQTYKDTSNRNQVEYILDKELTLTLVSGYNVHLRNQIIKRWQELESQSKPQMTQMEIIAHSAMALVTQEKRLNEVAQNQIALEEKFEQLKESTAILPKRPTNAEGVTFIRARMHSYTNFQQEW